MLSIWLQASQNRTKTWPDIAHNRIDMDMWHGWETQSLAKENIGKRRKSIFLDDWSAMKCRFKFGTYHFALFEVALFFQGDFLLLDCSWFLADFQLLGSCSRSQNHMVWECLGYLGTGQILVIFLVKSSKLNKIEKHEFRVEKHNLTRQ